MTLNAIVTALKSASPNSQQGGQPQGGQQGGVNIIDELMKDPNVKAIAEKLKAANIDLSKMTPEQIIPKIQEIAGDILTANPNLLPTIKAQVEKLLNIKLPDLGQPQANTSQSIQPEHPDSIAV